MQYAEAERMVGHGIVGVELRPPLEVRQRLGGSALQGAHEAEARVRGADGRVESQRRLESRLGFVERRT